MIGNTDSRINASDDPITVQTRIVESIERVVQHDLEYQDAMDSKSESTANITRITQSPKGINRPIGVHLVVQSESNNAEATAFLIATLTPVVEISLPESS